MRTYPRSSFSFRGNIRTYPRSSFRFGGEGEHPPKPPFWKPPFWVPPIVACFLTIFQWPFSGGHLGVFFVLENIELAGCPGISMFAFGILVVACLAPGDRIFVRGSNRVSKIALRSCGCFCLISGHIITVWKGPRSPIIALLRSYLLPLTPIPTVRLGPMWQQDLAILSPEGPRDSTCQLRLPFLKHAFREVILWFCEGSVPGAPPLLSSGPLRRPKNKCWSGRERKNT